MTENMKMFLEIASKNEELREKLNKMDKEALIAAAKALGIELTEADFGKPDSSISNDELETVVGGGVCACVTYGGGKAGGYDNACGCYIFGAGEGAASDGKGNYGRCFCFYGGGGTEAVGPTNYECTSFGVE